MQHTEPSDAKIREIYRKRDASGKKQLYTWWLPDVLVHDCRFRAAAAEMLVQQGFADLSGAEVLDVGCGVGKWLRTLLEWGADPARLHGIDLIEDRIDEAKRRSPNIDFRVGSGWHLPFGDQVMDLVCAHTVFSSIDCPVERARLAKEMMRVVKTEGAIFVYDFRVSHPRNPDTTGIRLTEIRRLFPSLRVYRRTLVLVPPLQRVVARVSPLAAYALDVLVPFARSHVIYYVTGRG